MSTIRFLAIVLLSTSLYAQSSSVPADYVIELYDIQTNALIKRAAVHKGHFPLENIPVGTYSVRLLKAQGEAPILVENHRFEPGGAPLVLILPEPAAVKPNSSLVSLNELKNPIPKKALREVLEAQRSARANDVRKAIAKLEHAIHLYPFYGDAHLNLGLQYARTGRTVDARTEFQKALDIGPPAAPIYADLAIASLLLGERQEAAAFAHRALEMDPSDSTAQEVLQTASFH